MVKKGLLKFMAGMAVGAGAAMAIKSFADSEKGKMAKEKMKMAYSDFHKKMYPKLEEMCRMGQDKYKFFIKKAAWKFAEANNIAEDKISDLIKETEKLWRDYMPEEEEE